MGKITKKPIKAKHLLIGTILCYVIAFFMDNIIGYALGTLGFLLLILTVVAFMRERKNKQ